MSTRARQLIERECWRSQPLILAFLLVPLALLAACEIEFASAPRDPSPELLLAPMGRSHDRDVPHEYCSLGAGEPLAGGGRVSVGEYVIGTADDYVRASLPGGPRWVRQAAPIAPGARALVMRLVREDAPDLPCASADVLPFADTDRAIVTTDQFVRAVQFSTQRVRVLDQSGAMLEGCTMQPGRETLRCALDMWQGEVHFDMDGAALDDTFTPHWQR